MFTMPAIHHSSAPMEDGCMGTLALNALNGSSDSLGHSDTSRSEYSGVFGGIFSSSLTESHPYRPQDSGMSFRETSRRSSTSSSTTSSSSKTVQRAHSFLKKSEPRYQLGQRRRSLDLDRLSVSCHSRYEDRSHSIGEIMLGRESRLAQLLDDSIDESELSPEVDFSGLRLTEQCIDPGPHGADSCWKSCHTSSKNKKTHKTEAATSIMANKLTENMKDCHKDSKSHTRHTRGKEDESQEQCQGHMTSSKHEKTRHNKVHHQSDSAQKK